MKAGLIHFSLCIFATIMISSVSAIADGSDLTSLTEASESENSLAGQWLLRATGTVQGATENTPCCPSEGAQPDKCGTELNAEFIMGDAHITVDQTGNTLSAHEPDINGNIFDLTGTIDQNSVEFTITGDGINPCLPGTHETTYIGEINGPEIIGTFSGSGSYSYRDEQGEHNEQYTWAGDFIVELTQLQVTTGLPFYEGKFKNKVFKRGEQLARFDVDAKIPEGASVRVNIFKDNIKLEPFITPSWEDNIKGKYIVYWDWTSDSWGKIPDEVPVGEYEAQAEIVRDGVQIGCSDKKKFYAIFNDSKAEKMFTQSDIGDNYYGGEEHFLNIFPDLGEYRAYKLNIYKESIFNTSIKCVNSEVSPMAAANLLRSKVTDKLVYVKAKDGPNPSRSTIDYETGRRKGQCMDYANLLTAYLRTIGIPSRPITTTNFDKFNYHCWTEAWLHEIYPSENDKWVVLDATDGRNYEQDAIKPYYYWSKHRPDWDSIELFHRGIPDEPNPSECESLVYARDHLLGRTNLRYIHYDTTSPTLDYLKVTETSSNSACPNNISISIATDKLIYPFGQYVFLQVKIENRGYEEIEIPFHIGVQQFADERKQCSMQNETPTILYDEMNVSLAAKESKLLDYSISQSEYIATGHYIVYAGSNESCIGGTEFDIISGLNVSVSNPASVYVDETFNVSLNISNILTRPVSNINITPYFPSDSNLAGTTSFAIPNLNPGESNVTAWPMSISGSDIHNIIFLVSSNDSGFAQVESMIRVLAPAELYIEDNYISIYAESGEPAKINFSVENIGDRTASNVIVNMTLPENVTGTQTVWHIGDLIGRERISLQTNIALSKFDDFIINLNVSDSSGHQVSHIIFVDVHRQEVVAIDQDKTFAEFNYHNHWSEDGIEGFPWPTDMVAYSQGNTAFASINASPGCNCSAMTFTEIGLNFSWDLGDYRWNDIENWPIDVIVNYSYDIQALYDEGYGSANAGAGSINSFWHDIVGYENGSAGNRSNNVTERLSMTVGQLEEWQRNIKIKNFCQAHSSDAAENWHSALSNVVLHNITIDFEEPPSRPLIPNGLASGVTETTYSYSTSATDPNEDQIKYIFDWGDNTSSTTDLVNSGTTKNASHSWTNAGVYQVRAMATNSKGASSDWSGELEVTIEEGDIPDQIGVFRNGGLYFDANGDGYWSAGDTMGWFGATGDLPVAGDWDGNGKDEIAVFRNGAWYFDANGDGYWSAGDTTGWFGATGDLPAAGDWDGDGKDEIAVFRNGGWYFDANGDGYWTAGDTTGWFGASGDLPAAGDWDGDGKDEIAVFRNGGWYFDANGDRYWTAGDTTGWFGATGDLPAAGDWDGDGKDEIAVFRNGGWYFDSNGDRYWTEGDTTGWFGATGDRPVAGRWGFLSSSLALDQDKPQLDLREMSAEKIRQKRAVLEDLQEERSNQIGEIKIAQEALLEKNRIDSLKP